MNELMEGWKRDYEHTTFSIEKSQKIVARCVVLYMR